MKFDAYKKEFEHVSQVEAKLNKVAQRRYVLDRRQDDYGVVEMYANVNVVPYPEGPMIHLSMYHSRQGQFSDYGSVSETVLLRFVIVRQTIDQWIGGHLDELPAEMPWEEGLWQLPK